jgi:hypothetical protein
MPPGQPWHYPLPPQSAAPPRKPPWPRRHGLWSAVIAFLAVLAIIGGATSCTGSRNAASSSPAPSARPTPTPTAAASTLSCDAQPLARRPADHTVAKVRVSTAAHAQVSAAGPLALVRGERAAGPASADGTRTLRFRVGDARPGVPVVIMVAVSLGASTGSCQATLRPRAAAVTAAAAPPRPTSAPPAAAPPSAAAPAPPPPTAASCHPLSDEGTCYEPGEFCRDSDHGMTGVAGDGKAIECEDNDGWRWEPI